MDGSRLTGAKALAFQSGGGSLLNNNKGLIAGLIKGNQWLIRPYFGGSIYYLYTRYILPSRGLYNPYHLLSEPELNNK